jgi:hypothetical protein
MVNPAEIARHEAVHAVVGTLLGLTVEGVHIGGDDGCCVLAPGPACTADVAFQVAPIVVNGHEGSGGDRAATRECVKALKMDRPTFSRVVDVLADLAADQHFQAATRSIAKRLTDRKFVGGEEVREVVEYLMPGMDAEWQDRLARAVVCVDGWLDEVELDEAGQIRPPRERTPTSDSVWGGRESEDGARSIAVQLSAYETAPDLSPEPWMTT